MSTTLVKCCLAERLKTAFADLKLSVVEAGSYLQCGHTDILVGCLIFRGRHCAIGHIDDGLATI